ncbi:integrase [Metapseudomonas resinovorans]|uniref:hypothetical protein n=1 Tax=Metapseudomonas resinovorans TaxID=53412 RepID=UPI003D233A5A
MNLTFWITPISLFTGMRLNEICQLEIRTIREKEDGWIVAALQQGEPLSPPA